MAYTIGLTLAIAVSAFAAAARFDRDRALYPTVLIIVASYYLLFAAMDGSARVLIVESIVAIAFVGLATVGFRSCLWLVAIGLAAHGVFDAFHGQLVTNPSLPEWWPRFCMAYDISAAGCLAWLLLRRPAASRAREVALG